MIIGWLINYSNLFWNYRKKLIEEINLSIEKNVIK